MPSRRVFVDTSVVHHSVRAVSRVTRRDLYSAGDTTAIRSGFWLEITTPDPAESVVGTRLHTEIEAIGRVVELRRSGVIELVWNVETHLEYLRQVPSGFFGYSVAELLAAGIEYVDAPIRYFRSGPIVPALDGSGESPRDEQLRFLRGLKQQRFLELQRATGANQGARVVDRQLLDAFHLWCAEHASSEFFLTTDFKLINHVRRTKRRPPKVTVVGPSELLAAVTAEVAGG